MGEHRPNNPSFQVALETHVNLKRALFAGAALGAIGGYLVGGASAESPITPIITLTSALGAGVCIGREMDASSSALNVQGAPVSNLAPPVLGMFCCTRTGIILGQMCEWTGPSQSNNSMSLIVGGVIAAGGLVWAESANNQVVDIALHRAGRKPGELEP